LGHPVVLLTGDSYAMERLIQHIQQMPKRQDYAKNNMKRNSRETLTHRAAFAYISHLER